MFNGQINFIFSKMAEGVGNAVKYGLAGIVVGTTTGFLTDTVYSKVAGYTSWGNEGNVSKSAVSLIVAGTLSAGFMFGGDMVLESAMDVGKDPLFRIMFYQSCFLSQNTVKVAIGGVRSLLGGIGLPSMGGGGGGAPGKPNYPVMGPAQMPVPRVSSPPQVSPVVTPPVYAEHPMIQQYGGPSNCGAGLGGGSCGAR